MVPYWPSAPFWPFLVERKEGFRSFVLDSLFVENGKNVYLHGEINSTLFGSEVFGTPVFFCFFCLTELYRTVSSKICL